MLFRKRQQEFVERSVTALHEHGNPLGVAPPTERQLQFLPTEYRHDHNLTRYQASALLTFRYKKSAIQSLIFKADRLAIKERV